MSVDAIKRHVPTDVARIVHAYAKWDVASSGQYLACDASALRNDSERAIGALNAQIERIKCDLTADVSAITAHHYRCFRQHLIDTRCANLAHLSEWLRVYDGPKPHTSYYERRFNRAETGVTSVNVYRCECVRGHALFDKECYDFPYNGCRSGGACQFRHVCASCTFKKHHPRIASHGNGTGTVRGYTFTCGDEAECARVLIELFKTAWPGSDVRTLGRFQYANDVIVVYT
jgi:hypothetical protein